MNDKTVVKATFIFAIIVMCILLLTDCTKDDINNALSNTVTVTTTTTAAASTCDTLWWGTYKISSVSKFTWKGIEQWQGIAKPIPALTPSNMVRHTTVVTHDDTLKPNKKLYMILCDD